MTDIVRLTLLSVISLCIFSFVGSHVFNYFYQSEAEKAIQESTLFLEQAKKNQEAYLEAQYKIENNRLKQQLALERKINSQIRDNYSNINYQSHNHKEQYRLKQEAYDLQRKQRQKERIEKRNKQIAKIRRENEQDRADRAHIRKENMKTCLFWREKFKEIPSDKNKLFKEQACKRAYQ